MKTKKSYSPRLFDLTLVFLFLVYIGFSCASKDQYANSEEFNKSAGVYSEKTDDMSMDEGEEDAFISADTISNEDIISSSAAVVSKDSQRKFIRTADIKFRVNDVRSSTLKIEDIVGEHAGFVSYTELRSVKQGVERVDFSEDSVMEILHYVVENDMTLRVPDDELDSTLRAIGKLAIFLDYRIIKADDVGLSLYSNELAAKRLSKHQQRITNAIDNKGNRLNDIVNAEDSKLRRQEELDRALIEKLSLQDKIDYSTIQLKLYQQASIMKILVEREKEIKPYKPGFDTRLGNGVMTGWKILEYLVLGIVHLWSIILLIGIVLFVIWYYHKKNKKK